MSAEPAPESRNGVADPRPETDYRDVDIAGASRPPLRLRFDPAINFDGVSYGELVFDFNSLTGKDLLIAEKAFKKTYKPEKDEIVMPMMQTEFHYILAAHLADVPPGLMKLLPLRAVSVIYGESLKACGGSPEEEV